MRLCGLLLPLLLLAAPSTTQVDAKRARTRSSKKAARVAAAKERAVFLEQLERDRSTAPVESWLRPALETALASTGGNLTKTATVVISPVTLTGGEILDYLKALGWAGFTADADQQVGGFGGQQVEAASGVCDPNGVTGRGTHYDEGPQRRPPVTCNGCVHDYRGGPEAGCGCYNGFCWASCTGGLPGSSREWCYTNYGGRSQDYNYKTCTKNSDCTYDGVKCAGSCTL